MSDMEIGQLVDYIEEYNRMHDQKQGRRSGKKNEPEPDTVNRRKATQADWDAFLG